MITMKAALYIRVSTEDQVREGYSLEVQREYLESFASREGYEVYNVYCDEGISAYSTRRPELQKLLSDAKEKRFEVVLVYKIDRFSRNLKDLLTLVDELSDAGVGFKSATEPFDTTNSAGKLMFQQLGSFAEFERNRIAERVFPGMVKGVQSGNWQGARYAPYGYTYNKADKMLYVVETEANVVKLIYTMYLAGKSIRGIITYLNNKGYRKRSGAEFNTKFVGDILKNRIYIGELVWNKKRYDTTQKTKKHYRYVKNDSSEVVVGKGRHEPIIDGEDFEQVQAILEKRKEKSTERRKNHQYMFGGLLTCEKCNRRYTGYWCVYNHRTKAKKRWYKCSGPVAFGTRCTNKSLREEDIVPEVTKILYVIANNKRFRESRWISLTSKKSDNFAVFAESDKKDAEKRLKKNQQKQSKLTDAYLDAILGEDVYREKMECLREEEDALKKGIAGKELRAMVKERTEGYVERVKEFLEGHDETKKSLDARDKKEMLGLVFNQIKIAPAIGGASPQKRMSFQLHEPFKSLYLEAKRELQCKAREQVIKTKGKESILELMDVK